ncbi:DUF1643 domain-containing protein [Granulicella paludicola]|uniref:DUF1643 domain-containing protein n=1 Tax=Granulicella paludicola TaxID=474951 RepID=UPI0021E0578E|nr:DUF1643 domain-containing protein [Granulicella paludicola]
MSATISKCGKYRYRLERTIGPTTKTCLFIMLNPSTADATLDDLTIKRCMRFAKDCGYGRMIVGNLFAFRTTYPTELKVAAKPEGLHNLRHLKAMCDEADMVIAAWGEDGKHFGQDKKILAQLKEWGVELHALKLTKDGHPRHPSRLSAALRPQPWA